MKKLSTCAAAILVLAISIVFADSTLWPLGSSVDLSSGFGDFREGRFHAGVDIRTGGRVGRRLTSPVDGYVYRLKMSYRGSGKALYIMGDDGYLYVFYHLSGFNDEIDQIVQQAQIAAHAYHIDIYVPKDSIRVSRGTYLAKTGQTGAGAPHLHFEKRTADNRPINPLAHGYQLNDTVAPTINLVGFEMTDDESLFDGGDRRAFVSPVIGDQPGVYTLDEVYSFKKPFGFLIEGWDRMRIGGMKQSIYRLRVYLDDDEVYRSIFDSLSFDTDPSVRFVYDHRTTVEPNIQVRRLYDRPGNYYAGNRALDNYGGIIGADPGMAYGRHSIRLVAEDCFGNSTETAFDFVWAPDQDLYVLDTMISDTLSEGDYRWRAFFTPSGQFPELGIDSVVLLAFLGSGWRTVDNDTVHVLDDGRLRIDIPVPRLARTLMLCLGSESRYGPTIQDRPFNGIRRRAGKDPDLELIPQDDGLIVHLPTLSKWGSQAHIALYYQDSLLGREYHKRFFDFNNYYFFIRPKKEYSRVDRIDVFWALDTLLNPALSKKVQLAAVGFREVDTIGVDTALSIQIKRKDVLVPFYISIDHASMISSSRFGLSSDLYSVLPETMPVRDEYSMRVKRTRKGVSQKHSGLCWLDERKNRWIWLEDSTGGAGFAGGPSLGGGKFGIVADPQVPVIDRMSIIPNRTVNTSRPEIEFRLVDSLSGFADESNIDIRIDGEWMIPEYDPETEMCRTRPVEPLADGEHYLTITATDNSGRKVEEYVLFHVKTGKTGSPGE